MTRRKPNVSKALKDHPGREDIRGIAEDIDTYAALAAIANQQGGQILITTAVKDVISAVDGIAAGYEKLSHAELMGKCATLRANLAMLRTLTRADKNLDLASEALEDAVKE